jgi:four helix bundle protein
MDEKMFKERTKRLALAVIQMVGKFPRSVVADAVGRQIVRSATSVGANYRAACRSKSTADMINKLKVVEEECDETAYWLELIVEANLFAKEMVAPLAKEADEILAMTVASLKTLRARQANSNRKS